MTSRIKNIVMKGLYWSIVYTGRAVVATINFILPAHRPSARQLRDDARQEEARAALETSIEGLKLVIEQSRKPDLKIVGGQ